jgi:hypothetical protein
VPTDMLPSAGGEKSSTVFSGSGAAETTISETPAEIDQGISTNVTSPRTGRKLGDNH